MTPETFEKDGITIEMTLNADRSVNLHAMMTVIMPMANGETVTHEMMPSTLPDKKFGTIAYQFEYAKTYKNFKEKVAWVKEKAERGGARPGAGRKKKDPTEKKQTGTWALARDVRAHIQKQPNQVEFLEGLVRADMTKSQPE